MDFYSQAHICQCLSRISTLRRELPVTFFGNRQKTGDQFADSVLSLARGLQEFGLKRGDVVAIAALNSDLYLEWLLAVTFVGGIAAPLNHRWSFDEAQSAIDLVRPVMLVVDESCSSWALELHNNKILSLKSLVFMGDPSSISTNNRIEVTTESIRRPLQGPQTFDYVSAPEGIALICFTSGTTGQPKGVAIRHMALIVQSLAKIAIVGYGEDDVYLHTAPLCHIGGISSGLAMLMVGACHILIPKFEAKSAFQAIEQHHVTSLITIPTMMADMIFTHRRQNRLSGGETVKKILNGGGGLSTELTEGATKIFPNAKLLSAYGMTEACSSLTFMTFQNLALQDSGKLLTKNFGAESGISYRPGGVRVGKPAPHVELQISSGNYKDGPFVVGRILTRGVHVMVGYWGQSLEIPSASDEHGWLDTGDIGWIDEYGDLWLVGRTKDRIKSGGENVYPEEVEAVILQHPGISDIVVIGVPDLRLTEMVVACVQIKDNWHWVTRNYRGPYGETEHFLSGEILQNYCKQKNLTRFKIPKKFLPWRESFPTTTTGKLRRDEVRRRAMSLVEFFPSNL